MLTVTQRAWHAVWLVANFFLTLYHQLQSSRGRCSKNPEWVISKGEIQAPKKETQACPNNKHIRNAFQIEGWKMLPKVLHWWRFLSDTWCCVCVCVQLTGWWPPDAFSRSELQAFGNRPLPALMFPSAPQISVFALIPAGVFFFWILLSGAQRNERTPIINSVKKLAERLTTPLLCPSRFDPLLAFSQPPLQAQ